MNGVVPLVKVLRLVDGDVKAAIGYIYKAMDNARAQIENNSRMWRATMVQSVRL